jgi:hypothetical protein
MSLHHDLQTVVFPYLDIFTKIKFSHINWTLYENMFKLNIDDVQIILQEYGQNEYMPYFFKKRFDYNSKHTDQMKIYIDNLIKKETDKTNKIGINKLLDEHNVSVKFFQTINDVACAHQILVRFREVKITDIIQCCNCLHYDNVILYKKLLPLLNDGQFSAVFNKMTGFRHYHGKGFWQKIILKLILGDKRALKHPGYSELVNRLLLSDNGNYAFYM